MKNDHTTRVLGPVAHITALAQAILAKTQYLTKSLARKDPDAPSDNSSKVAFDKLDLEDRAVRSELITLTQELHDALVGPKDTLKNLAWNVSGGQYV